RLRSNWTLRNGLVCNDIHHLIAMGVKDRLARCVYLWDLHRLDELRGIVGLEILHHSLRHKNQRAHNAHWQKYPKIASDQIDPEVADGVHLAASNSANECNRENNADGGRHEVVI